MPLRKGYQMDAFWEFVTSWTFIFILIAMSFLVPLLVVGTVVVYMVRRNERNEGKHRADKEMGRDTK